MDVGKEEHYASVRDNAHKMILERGSLPIINPLTTKSTNFSKFQHLIRLAPIAKSFGIEIPRTVLTNTISRSLGCFEKGQPLIVKGASSKKTQVVKYEQECLKQMVCAEPVIAQQWIDGDDLRVHVVGDACVAERIQSDAVDYRSSGRNKHENVAIPEFIHDFCVEVSRSEGLVLSGVDFLVRDGKFYFLEVNSDPDFRGYDKRSGFAISRNIVEYMVSGAAHQL